MRKFYYFICSFFAVLACNRLLRRQSNTLVHIHVQGGSNMTRTVYTCLHTNQSRSYLNHLVLIRSNKMQQYAGFYLLQKYSACFGCLSHPSSGVYQIVTAASGTGHSVRATTFRQRGLIRPRWRKVFALTRDTIISST